jgi:hypothetical protein
MDNLVKHLFDKIELVKEVKQENEKTIIKIYTKNGEVDNAYLRKISETYKLCSEISNHVKNSYLYISSNEIIIIY